MIYLGCFVIGFCLGLAAMMVLGFVLMSNTMFQELPEYVEHE